MSLVVGTPVATATTPGTLTVTFPSYAAGDSMFILCGAKQMSTDTFPALTGWDTIISVRTSTVVAIGVYHRIMDGTEGSSVNITTIGSNDVNMAIAWVDEDLDGTDAIDVIGADQNSATGSGAMTLPGITAGTSKRLYGAWVGFDNDGTSGTVTGASAFTHPADMTELFDAVTDEGNDLSMGAAYLDTVTGATGTRDVTGTPASLSNYRCIGLLFSANPGAGGGTPHEEEVNDSVTPTDNLSRVADRARTVDDSTTPADVLARVHEAARSVPDTLALDDNVTVDHVPAGGTPHEENPEDTVTLDDSATVEWVANREADDTVTLADDQTLAVGLVRDSDNAVTVTDEITPVLNPGATDYEQPVDDTLSLADEAVVDWQAVRAAGDSVTPADQIEVVRAIARTIEDTLSLADGQAFTFDFGRLIEDTLTLADNTSTSASGAHTVTPNDTLELADELLRALEQHRTPADPVALADALSRAIAAARVIADPVAVADSVAIVLMSYLDLADTVSLADEITVVKNAEPTELDEITTGWIAHANRVGRIYSPAHGRIAPPVTGVV